MKQIGKLLSVCILVLIQGCFVVKTKKERTSEERSLQTRRPPVEEVKPSKTYQYTFLDTINKGKEIFLTDADFRKSDRSTETAASSEQSVDEMRYRIQILASNRIDMVREQKKELEKKIKEDIIIGYEAPYYKLYIGNFTRRQDAQPLLLKIKKMGFNDAWIVSTAVQPIN